MDVGANKNGIYYLVVYGNAYSRVQEPSEKRKLLECFRIVCLSISEQLDYLV